MPTRRWLAPAIGLGAVALAVGTSTSAFAAAPHAAAHVHPHGDVMLSSGTQHLSSASSAHRGGPAILHDSSGNWAGYAATGSTYTSVSSNWVQPSVNCDSGDGYSAFWVGLDGDGSDSVEQTGSEADCSGGQAEYSAWYEMYPADSVNYDDNVEAGDSFSASVDTDGDGDYTLTLTDNTQGWTETQNETSSSAADASAEVIAEAPSSDSGQLPLSDFGTVDFTDATVNGSALGDSSPDEIDMVSNGDTLATTSGLDGSGEDFSVTWDASS